MDKLLIHTKTNKQLSGLLSKPTNSILMLGGTGSGKLALSVSLAHSLLKLKPKTTLVDYPYFAHIERDEGKQDIPIDKIRRVIGLLRLKTPGKEEYRRLILIENAQDMNAEAQNALLKVLEEPNPDTVFILTATSENELLPTIVSRCQKILVFPVSMTQASEYYGSKYSSKKLESAWQLSQGRAGLLQALLMDDDQHPLKQAIQKAKDFLQMPKNERLLNLEQITKDRNEQKLFLDALSRVVGALHHLAVKKSSPNATALLKDRKTILEVSEGVGKNTNTKLANLKLLTSLSI